MKIRTDLKAGSPIGETAQQTAGLIAEADQQAESIANTIVSSATTFWNCLTTSLQQG